MVPQVQEMGPRWGGVIPQDQEMGPRRGVIP